jgi:hypothetical protein
MLCGAAPLGGGGGAKMPSVGEAPVAGSFFAGRSLPNESKMSRPPPLRFAMMVLLTTSPKKRDQASVSPLCSTGTDESTEFEYNWSENPLRPLFAYICSFFRTL